MDISTNHNGCYFCVSDIHICSLSDNTVIEMCNNYRDSPNRFYSVADLEQLLLSYLSLQEIIPTQ